MRSRLEASLLLSSADMGFLISVAIVTALVAVGWSLARRLNARLEQQQQELRALAARHGWHLDQVVDRSFLYRIHGVTGRTRWQLVAEHGDPRMHQSPSTKWSTDEVHSHDLVGLIRTRRGFEQMSGMWGKAAQGLLSAMVRAAGIPAPQHEELVRTGTRLVAASADVSRTFVAIVRPQRGVEGLLTPALESALLAWHALPISDAQKDSLNVDVGQTNLRVYCTGTIAPEYLERLIAIGIAAADACADRERAA